MHLNKNSLQMQRFAAAALQKHQILTYFVLFRVTLGQIQGQGAYSLISHVKTG